jgi:tetratricopeptide (TPR) repeat protein
MTLFDGLFGYEIILLCMGVVLFFVVIGLLIYQVKKGRNPAVVAGCLIFPIAMVGYPGVKTIEPGKIEKTVHDLQQDPTNQAKRQQLQEQLKQAESRPYHAPENLLRIATAEYALGNEPAAKFNLDQALSTDPHLPAAQDLQQKIATVDRVRKLSAVVQSNPSDAQAKSELKSTLNSVSQKALANPAALGSVAEAHAAVGDTQKAAATASTALKIDPNIRTAEKLRVLAAQR